MLSSIVSRRPLLTTSARIVAGRVRLRSQKQI
jgi:hypothetical protein